MVKKDDVSTKKRSSSAAGSRLGKKKAVLQQLQQEKEVIDSLPVKESVGMQQSLQWNSALARAQGQKVLDDPTKLRKSIKREEKQKQKSKVQWEARKNSVSEAQKAKQDKRKANLEARKKPKAGVKTAKPNKRPGFEGKRQKAINPKKKS
ncbi:hypothetical protein GEMRC1_010725 [Eukaryota sp. GEM-RC1]